MTSRTTIQRMIASLPLDLATAELETVIDNLAYEVAAHRLQTSTGVSGEAPSARSGPVAGVVQPDAGFTTSRPGRVVEAAYQVTQEISI